MDALSDPAVHTLVGITAVQVGKTEIVNNLVGYHIDQDPAPILVMQPNVDPMAKAWSKDRLGPMLRDTPCLQGKVSEARSADGGNEVLHKIFPGGHVTIVGANAPSGLASRPIRIVICDEVDRYPASAGDEGDPVSLAKKRTLTFWNRKLILFSTPTIKGVSRIEAAWEESDHRLYHVPCPHCAHRQTLRFAQVIWPEGRPAEARYVCEACAEPWSEDQRLEAVMRGEWRATKPFAGTAGFHLNAFVSPWVTLGELAVEFVQAKPYPERLKVFVNTVLGETWEDPAEKIDHSGLLARREAYESDTPAGVVVIVVGVDVQNDRLELEFLGLGLGEETWSLEYRVIPGDPATNLPWRALDELLLRPRMRADGVTVSIAAAAVDTGGHHTQSAYAFCRDRYARRVWAVKGSSEPGKPIWPKRPNSKNAGRLPLFLVGTDSAKDLIYARLRVATPGPGYCHFPDDRDADYFAQLTAERIVTKYQRGFPRRVWVKDPGKRNEGLDVRVYGICAFTGLVSMGLDLEREAKRLDAIAAGMRANPGQAPAPQPSGRRLRSPGISPG
jgi:phage terminase large subunit GpA-like protein